MEPFARQQFDVLLSDAITRYVERLEHRCGGLAPALTQLREDPNGTGAWLDEFVGALFADALLDTPAGACWVLQALGRRPTPSFEPSATVDETLDALARQVFATLLCAKTEEALEQRLAFEST